MKPPPAKAPFRVATLGSIKRFAYFRYAEKVALCKDAAIGVDAGIFTRSDLVDEGQRHIKRENPVPSANRSAALAFERWASYAAFRSICPTTK